ncbi:hypothetical protein CMK18_23950 [Candidatus Poribacteria bacterium]|nr:hypothetical protein [Candidatus Poribacteria bacterium]|tara:strand:+ start:29 stop:847 length:819 start_codon:yes stop_codon:yes gene_type:complete
MYHAISETKKLIQNANNESPISNIPIYIPSKGRADRVLTCKFLSSFNYKIVVEPQDYIDYSLFHDEKNLLKLEADSQGIAYVRSFIKQYSKDKNEKYHWQLDDDMVQYRKRIGSKNEKTTFRQLKHIVETVTLKYSNVALAGLTSAAYAFAKKEPLELNRFPYCNVLIKNDTDIWWDRSINYGDDWDYLLQTLEKGYCTFAFTHLLHENKPMGNNKGGLDYAYEKNVIVKNMEGFIAKYPDYFAIAHKPESNKPYRLKHKKRFFKQFTQQPC